MSTRPVSPRTRQDRDAGLARIKRVTRWSAAGALAGTGLFAGLAAHASGSAASTAPTKTAQQSSAAAPAASGSSAASATTATNAPTVVPSTSTPVVTSGAS
ncbi:MAG TPA: hypothetical protein VGP92_05055 [Acidimicrobiia bacterium]|nr:hypothetical protein [Acidimicrobiia bacterium]